MVTDSGWSEDSAAASDRAGQALDESLAPVAPALDALDPLAALVPDSPDRLESRKGIFEVDLLVRGRFGAGSWVPLLGTSSSVMISLLLFLFFDIFDINK